MTHRIDHENDGNMGENAGGKRGARRPHIHLPAVPPLQAPHVLRVLEVLSSSPFTQTPTQRFIPSLPVPSSRLPCPWLRLDPCLCCCPAAPADKGLLRAPLQSTREAALGKDLGVALRSCWLVPLSRWPFAILSLSTDSPCGLWALTQATETITFSNCSVEPSCSACLIPSTYCWSVRREQGLSPGHTA